MDAKKRNGGEYAFPKGSKYLLSDDVKVIPTKVINTWARNVANSGVKIRMPNKQEFTILNTKIVMNSFTNFSLDNYDGIATVLVPTSSIPSDPESDLLMEVKNAIVYGKKEYVNQHLGDILKNTHASDVDTLTVFEVERCPNTIFFHAKFFHQQLKKYIKKDNIEMHFNPEDARAIITKVNLTDSNNSMIDYVYLPFIALDKKTKVANLLASTPTIITTSVEEKQRLGSSPFSYVRKFEKKLIFFVRHLIISVVTISADC